MAPLRSLYTSLFSFKSQRANGLVYPLFSGKDTAFDELYPEHIKALSAMHWTAVDIARKAGDFLSIPNARVLDIGSGVGKFCLVAGFLHPETAFYGIEQRKKLHTFAEIAKEEIGLPNVHFIHGNLVELDFSGYNHFYCYNPFYENIEPDSRIDYSVKTSFELYHRYSRLVYEMLDGKPPETRLVTFHCTDSQVPPAYKLVNHSSGTALKMWIKE